MGESEHLARSQEARYRWGRGQVAHVPKKSKFFFDFITPSTHWISFFSDHSLSSAFYKSKSTLPYPTVRPGMGWERAFARSQGKDGDLVSTIAIKWSFLHSQVSECFGDSGSLRFCWVWPMPAYVTFLEQELIVVSSELLSNSA
jgi:hypothetical protein